MTTLRYPLSALFMDYALGLAGTAICLVMIITSGWTSHIIWLFIALTLCCLAYTMRTALQHRTVIGVDDNGITRTLFGSDRRIDWDHLAGLSLRYYPRRRQQKKKGMGGVLGRLGRGGFFRPQFQEIPQRQPQAADQASIEKLTPATRAKMCGKFF